MWRTCSSARRYLRTAAAGEKSDAFAGSTSVHAGRVKARRALAQDETIDFERFVGLVQDFCRTDCWLDFGWPFLFL